MLGYPDYSRYYAGIFAAPLTSTYSWSEAWHCVWCPELHVHDTLTITGYMCVWYSSNPVCIMHCRSIQCNCFTQSSGWQLSPTQLLVVCKLMATIGQRGFCTPVHSFLADSVVHILIRMALLGQISASNPFYVPQDIDHYYSRRAWASPSDKSNIIVANSLYLCMYVCSVTLSTCS